MITSCITWGTSLFCDVVGWPCSAAFQNGLSQILKNKSKKTVITGGYSCGGLSTSKKNSGKGDKQSKNTKRIHGRGVIGLLLWIRLDPIVYKHFPNDKWFINTSIPLVALYVQISLPIIRNKHRCDSWVQNNEIAFIFCHQILFIWWQHCIFSNYTRLDAKSVCLQFLEPVI